MGEIVNLFPIDPERMFWLTHWDELIGGEKPSEEVVGRMNHQQFQELLEEAFFSQEQ